jgi:hypothetical protein
MSYKLKALKSFANPQEAKLLDPPSDSACPHIKANQIFK